MSTTKQLKTIFIGLVIGLLIGLAVGVNIDREKPLLSNPFAKESLIDRAKRLGSETLRFAPGFYIPSVLDSDQKLARQSLRTLCCVEESPGSAEQDAG